MFAVLLGSHEGGCDNRPGVCLRFVADAPPRWAGAVLTYGEPRVVSTDVTKEEA